MLYRTLLTLILAAGAVYSFDLWQTGHFPLQLELRGLFADKRVLGVGLVLATLYALLVTGMRNDRSY